MNKLMSAAICLSLLVIASCKKPPGATSGGTWTLNQKTYDASQAYYVLGNLAAYTGTSNPTGSLSITFYDSISNATLNRLIAAGDDSISRPDFTWPPKLNSYILTNSFPPDSGYAYIQLTDSSLYESYVITGSTTPSITLTRSSAGLVTVTIPPVMVWNVNGTPVYFPHIIGVPTHADSSLVAGKVIQTQ